MSKIESPNTHRPVRNRPLGLLFQFLGVMGIFLAAAIFFIINAMDLRISWGLTLALNLLMAAIGAGSFLLISRGRQLAAYSGEDVLVKDPRPPIVYLRSFRGDQQDVISGYSWLGIPGTSDEQALAKLMARIGPFVAIGRPGEHLATLGAARMYVSDNDWQETVEDIVKRANLVVLRVGETAGFWWEVQRVLEMVAPERVLFFLGPPVTKASISAHESEYSAFRDRANEYLPRALPERSDSANFIGFNKDWTPLLLTLRGSAFISSAEERYASTLRPVLDRLGIKTPKPRRLARILFLLLLVIGAWVGFLVLMLLIQR